MIDSWDMTLQLVEAYEALTRTFSGLEIVMSGNLPEVGEHLIDHFAGIPALRTSSPRMLQSRIEAGNPLSDLVGYSVEMTLQ